MGVMAGKGGSGEEKGSGRGEREKISKGGRDALLSDDHGNVIREAADHGSIFIVVTWRERDQRFKGWKEMVTCPQHVGVFQLFV